MGTAIEGAWELISDTHNGMMIYTDKYYCNVTVRKDRAPFRDAMVTEAEEAAAYRTMGASAGTYSVNGSIVTRHEAIDRIPQAHVDDADFEFRIEGDRMTWQYVSRDGKRGPVAVYCRAGHSDTCGAG